MEPLKGKQFSSLGVDAHETHPDLAILRGVSAELAFVIWGVSPN